MTEEKFIAKTKRELHNYYLNNIKSHNVFTLMADTGYNDFCTKYRTVYGKGFSLFHNIYNE